MYTCDPGYRIVGQEAVVCQVGPVLHHCTTVHSVQTSGQWSGEQPFCRRAPAGGHSPFYCGAPPTMQNASHSGSPEQVSSTVFRSNLTILLTDVL